MKKIILTLCIVFLVGLAETYAQSYKVIANPSNKTTSLSAKEVSDIFLKKSKKWSDGTSIMPIDLVPNSAVRATFTQAIHGKNISAIRSYWQQAAFSGAGSPPPEKSTDEDIIEYVKSNAGAIGYVSTSTNTSSVKTINIQ